MRNQFSHHANGLCFIFLFFMCTRCYYYYCIYPSTSGTSSHRAITLTLAQMGRLTHSWNRVCHGLSNTEATVGDGGGQLHMVETTLCYRGSIAWVNRKRSKQPCAIGSIACCLLVRIVQTIGVTIVHG
jgi:hypothetical protein